MKTVVLGEMPPPLVSFLAERRRLGLDGHDEVWAGEHHMAPMGSAEHAAAELVTSRSQWYRRVEQGFEPVAASAVLGVSGTEVDVALGWVR